MADSSEITAPVFVGQPMIEKAGHVGHFSSTPDRISHVTCSCGWNASCFDGAEFVLMNWRTHVGGPQ